MLKKKISNVFLFCLICLIGFMCAQSFITHNQKASEARTQEQKVAKELAIENQRKLDEELLRAKIVRSNNFVKSISNEIEILLLSENGEHLINHDRTPENNWYSEWLKNAEIAIKLDYRTLFSIKTKDIHFAVTPEGAINVNYDSSKIVITAIDISNVIPTEKVNLFGLNYKPTEVTALENIAKGEIKALSYSDDNILKASNNLEMYLNDSATKFGIKDLCIIEDNQDIYLEASKIINQGT